MESVIGFPCECALFNAEVRLAKIFSGHYSQKSEFDILFSTWKYEKNMKKSSFELTDGRKICDRRANPRIENASTVRRVVQVGSTHLVLPRIKLIIEFHCSYGRRRLPKALLRWHSIASFDLASRTVNLFLIIPIRLVLFLPTSSRWLLFVVKASSFVRMWSRWAWCARHLMSLW